MFSKVLTVWQYTVTKQTGVLPTLRRPPVACTGDYVQEPSFSDTARSLVEFFKKMWCP
jgi:hypothetical protein